MYRNLVLILSLVALPHVGAHAAEPGVVAGPMVGHATPHDVSIWVRTNQPTSVSVEYWSTAHQGQVMMTSPKKTGGFDQRNVTIRLTELSPGQTYAYRLILGESSTRFEPSYPLKFETPPYPIRLFHPYGY